MAPQEGCALLTIPEQFEFSWCSKQDAEFEFKFEFKEEKF